jgi:hypothetical protein
VEGESQERQRSMVGYDNEEEMCVTKIGETISEEK